MDVEKHMNPTYTLNLTQDEYVAMIAALFISNNDALQKIYSRSLPQDVIQYIDKTQNNLAKKFCSIYDKDSSAEIINQIRSEGSVM